MAGDQPRNRGEESGGALKVSPHEAHRHAGSLVISFASVPTLADPMRDRWVGSRRHSFASRSSCVAYLAFTRRLTTAPATPSNSGNAQINAVAIKRSDATSHTCWDGERLTGLGRTDMNLSPDLHRCHAQFGHAGDSRLTIDAWNDPQLDG